MSVGLSKTKADFDNRAASCALDLRGAFERIKQFKSVLDATTDTELTTTPIGYTTGEVAQLRSAFVDLDKLRTIYEGTATQATTYDFRTFAKLLTGVV